MLYLIQLFRYHQNTRILIPEASLHSVQLDRQIHKFYGVHNLQNK